MPSRHAMRQNTTSAFTAPRRVPHATRHACYTYAKHVVFACRHADVQARLQRYFAQKAPATRMHATMRRTHACHARKKSIHMLMDARVRSSHAPPRRRTVRAMMIWRHARAAAPQRREAKRAVKRAVCLICHVDIRNARTIPSRYAATRRNASASWRHAFLSPREI